jgi:integrase
MQRKRKQRGSVVRIGGFWCLRYADYRVENGVLVRKQGLTHKLCSVLEEHARLRRPPTYVKDLRDAFMRGVNDTRDAPERCSTVSAFVEGTWLPHVEEHRSSSTATVYKFYWAHMLKPYVGPHLLRDFEPKQALHTLREIRRLNPEIHHATLQKLRSILSSIFTLAISLGDRKDGINPCCSITTPKGAPSSEMYAYSLEEIRQMLGLIEDETARIVVAIAGFAGLSKSEIQGLTWEAYDPHRSSLKVLCGVVNGKRGKTKTETRKSAVPLLPQVRSLLDLYRLRLGNPSTGAMFATEVGTPLDLHNVFTRQIEPVLNVCVACHKAESKHRKEEHVFERDPSRPLWHGWHALRRGLGSNLNEMTGIEDLTIQRILRHKNVATTRKHYIEVRDPAVDAAMEQLAAKVGPLFETAVEKAKRVN